MVDSADMLRLLHPAIAVTVVIPLVGMVVRLAWQTRQRRLEAKAGEKSKIPPVVGPDHLKLGRWLAAAVVGIELLGITRPMFKNIITKQVWSIDPFKVMFILLLYVATISSLVLLYRAQSRLWRATFAILTGMGLVILSFQDGIFRRDNEWFISHFYYGVTVALLMIFSLAIVPEIYQDRTHRWRIIHTVLNSIAVLLFIGQGLTGTRDLLEIPLSWQEPYIYSCDFVNKKCPEAAPPKQSEVPGVFEVG